ncbi:alpha/beta fold hydrolase [Streptomyces sp. SAI-195]|uniref:alpha/beta fold hydrolase n=1 Tax=Streptomyces sp. SAI-195 TaxID=3377734 RepID=UPI003C7AC8E3
MDWTLSEAFETPGGVVRWGTMGSGDPLVLVHGTPYSSFLWRDIAPALARTRTVFYFDHLGFGQSEQREGQDLSLAAHSRNFAQLLEHWGLSRPSVVAHDIGGAVALRTLLLEERNYRDLTLFDAVSGGEWERGLFSALPGARGSLPRASGLRPRSAGRKPSAARHARGLPAGDPRRVPRTVAARGRAGGVLPPVQPDQAGGHGRVRALAGRYLGSGTDHLGPRGPHSPSGVRRVAA